MFTVGWVSREHIWRILTPWRGNRGRKKGKRERKKEKEREEGGGGGGGGGGTITAIYHTSTKLQRRITAVSGNGDVPIKIYSELF